MNVQEREIATGSPVQGRTNPQPFRGSKIQVYLSWGGGIYGPTSREDVIAGLRTSSFEKEALYWHEGLEEWKPLGEFPLGEEPARILPRVADGQLPAAPGLPQQSNTGTGEASPRRKRYRRSRSNKPSSRQTGRGGRMIILAIAALAIFLIVGLLLLLMQV